MFIIVYTKPFSYVDHVKLYNIFKKIGIPEHFTFLSIPLQGMIQSYVFSSYLFSLYAEYILRSWIAKKMNTILKLEGETSMTCIMLMTLFW